MSIFLLNKEKVHCIQKGLGKLVSKANSKKQSIGTVNPQPSSSCNQASVDGPGNGKEEKILSTTFHHSIGEGWRGKQGKE